MKYLLKMKTLIPCKNSLTKVSKNYSFDESPKVAVSRSLPKSYIYVGFAEKVFSWGLKGRINSLKSKKLFNFCEYQALFLAPYLPVISLKLLIYLGFGFIQ
jgi:hypothetical protein